MNKILWQPSKQKSENSILEDFSNFIEFKSSQNFKELWKWSVSNPEVFENYWR